MKNILVLLLLALSITTQAVTSRADSAGNAAGAILISFAAAKGMQSVGVNALERMELEEWKDERSQSTTVLGDTCGFYYEARLIGDARYNYLWVTLKNNNSLQRSLNPIETEFKFSNGIERRPDLFRFYDVFFEPGRLYNMILPFPAKEDFKNQQSLTVNIPLYGEGKRCDVPVRLVRNSNRPDSIRSTVSQTMVDVNLSIGGAAVSGDLGNVLKKNLSMTSIVMTMSSPEGGGLYLGARFYENSNPSNDLAAREGYLTNWNIQASEFLFGYQKRFALKMDSSAYIRVGFGGVSLNVANEDFGSEQRHSGSALDLQAGYQKLFKKVKSGVWMGSYFWSAGITNSFVFGREPMKNGTKYDGNMFSALVSVGVGI